MIEVYGIEKAFKNNYVFKDASFNIPDGKISVLLGANGSGKTTLMRLMSTLLKPDRGRIFINGIDALDKPGIVRSKIGVLLGGDANLYSRLTGRENINYFAQLQGIHQKKVTHVIDNMRQIIDIDNCLQCRVGTFSRGMRQKIALVKSVIHNPDILFLDEPTTGLDIYSINDVENFIKNYKNKGKIIVLSTHNMHEADVLADNVFIIRDKQVLSTDYSENLLCKKEFSIMNMFLNAMEGK